MSLMQGCTQCCHVASARLDFVQIRLCWCFLCYSDVERTMAHKSLLYDACSSAEYHSIAVYCVWKQQYRSIHLDSTSLAYSPATRRTSNVWDDKSTTHLQLLSPLMKCWATFSSSFLMTMKIPTLFTPLCMVYLFWMKLITSRGLQNELELARKLSVCSHCLQQVWTMAGSFQGAARRGTFEERRGAFEERLGAAWSLRGAAASCFWWQHVSRHSLSQFTRRWAQELLCCYASENSFERRPKVHFASYQTW